MYDARRVRPIRVPSFLSNFLRILTTAVKLITTKDCSSNSDQWKETSDCGLLAHHSELVRRGRVRCGDDLRDVLLQRVQDDDGLFDLVHVEIVDALHLLVKDRGEALDQDIRLGAARLRNQCLDRLLQALVLQHRALPLRHSRGDARTDKLAELHSGVIGPPRRRRRLSRVIGSPPRRRAAAIPTS